MAKALKRLTAICRDIHLGKTKSRGHNPFGKLGGWLQRNRHHWAYACWIKTMATDRDRCNGCGICSQLCPVDNISMLDEKVVFGHKCIFCLRCYNLCPTNALLIGEGTKNEARYRRYKGAFKNTVKIILEDKKIKGR